MGERSLQTAPSPTEVEPLRRLRTCSGSGLPPSPWSLLRERTGREWEGRGPHSRALCIVIRHPV